MDFLPYAFAANQRVDVAHALWPGNVIVFGVELGAVAQNGFSCESRPRSPTRLLA